MLFHHDDEQHSIRPEPPCDHREGPPPVINETNIESEFQVSVSEWPALPTRGKARQHAERTEDPREGTSWPLGIHVGIN